MAVAWLLKTPVTLHLTLRVSIGTLSAGASLNALQSLAQGESEAVLKYPVRTVWSPASPR